MALGAGSIAFTAFNVLSNTTSQFNFVAVEGIVAGTTIKFTDNNWDGSSFTTNEATWTWTATSDIAPKSSTTTVARKAYRTRATRSSVPITRR